MTFETWLRETTKLLGMAGIATARLDALVLLEDRMGIDRAQLLAHPETVLRESDKNVLNNQIARRAEHVPLAYVRSKTEFYGREFFITPAVLEPRPESETMIDLFKELLQADPELAARQAEFILAPRLNHQRPAKSSGVLKLAENDVTVARKNEKNDDKRPVRVADVGSGSGAIGTTVKLEIPEISIDLLEIDDRAIEISKINVEKHTTQISVIKSDLLSDSPQDYDILLCNLPYVPDEYQINTAALHEPKVAIFGGPDGLDLYRRLFNQVKIVEKKPLYILIENLPFQHDESERIAAAANYALICTDDFIQVFKRT